MKLQTNDIPSIETDPKLGLSTEQVDQRIESKLTNVIKDKTSKTYWDIIKNNVFTLFNIVLVSIGVIYLIFVIYLYSNGYAEAANKYFGISKFSFLIPVILNIIMGTFQEIKSKKTLEKLKLVHESSCTVLRQGQEINIKTHEIVRDDIICLNAGNQAPCDIIIKDGFCQVDESLLTGESDLVKKNPGDLIYASSSVIIGYAKGQAIKVGNDTYASSLSDKVKSLAQHKSQLMMDIYKIIRYLTYTLFAVVIIVFTTLIFKVNKWGNDPSVFGEVLSLSSPLGWTRIFLTTGAFAISVIPTGLVLLTSITLAVSIIKLAQNKTMIQDLYSLENLSRVDTICLDKTGTLTDGTMNVCKVHYFIDEKSVQENMKDICGSSKSLNATSIALNQYFGKNENVQYKEIIPFSSEKKYSGLVYSNGDTLLIGAFEYLIKDDKEKIDLAQSYTNQGKRVLAIKKNENVLGLIILEDNLRSSAKDTIEFFYDNHVDVRIISGDNATTVSYIAKQAGVKNTEKAISLENVPLEKIPELVHDYVIFARVSPEQKQAIVESLQKEGHKVAMTGDGVNDILALRKSDASITFAKATDAAKSCSDVVLLDNDFSHLKEVVAQGRRVVNNIQRSATIFLMKSISMACLSVIFIPMKKGQMWFTIENLFLMETASIGIGGFFLSLEWTKEPIKGDFMKTVLFNASVAAALVLIGVTIPILLYEIPQSLNTTILLTENNLHSMISIMTALAGLTVTLSLCYPFSKYRTITFLIVSGTTILLCFMFPTSTIAGKTLSFSMFQSDTGFLNSQFIKELFRPWESESVRETFTNPVCLILICSYLVLGMPLFTLFMRKRKLKQK